MSAKSENCHILDNQKHHPVLNPILKVILEGVYDEECSLSAFRGCPHIVMKIWIDVKNFWKAKVIQPSRKNEDLSPSVLWHEWWKAVEEFTKDTFKSELFFTPLYLFDWSNGTTHYSFPTPTNININMMPFKVGEDFESCQLPEYIEPYWPLISTCLEPQMARASWHMWPRRSIPSDVGKVYYLTIQESWVDKGNSQRRPGLHVDSPGKVKFKGETPDVDRKGNGISQRYFGHRWGNGCAHYVRQETEEEYHPPVYTMKGGIYMASSVTESCKVWNCSVEPEAVEHLGDIEHLRSLLPGEGEVLKPDQLYWITDRTPHESLPLKEGTFRQFFRIVTSDVSLWYKEHSTANPMGVEPDPSITKIVIGNKFSEEGVEIIGNDL